MIGGASAVNLDICPFVLAEGNKAEIRGLNSIGLRRRGFTDEELSNLKKVYRIIFRNGLPLKEAVKQAEEQYGEDKNIKILLEFINGSFRGITR